MKLFKLIFIDFRHPDDFDHIQPAKCVEISVEFINFEVNVVINKSYKQCCLHIYLHPGQI